MNTIERWSGRLAMVAASVSGMLLPAEATDDTEAEIRALRAQIQVLDQRLHELEQRQLLKEQQAAAAAKAAPKVSLTDRGFTFASADGANSVSLRGLVQFDSRQFFGDGGVVNNSFLLRRARAIVEGTFRQTCSFQFVPEFGGTGAPSILDANVGVALSPAVQLKFGKFKAPVGLELLQSDSWTFFNERSLVTNLVPNRDVGVQVSGRLGDGYATYAAGLFNGLADGASSTNADFDNEKDVIGRLMLQPFKEHQDSPLRGFTFGAGASLGRRKTGSGVTGGYKTDGQQSFFKYRSGVVADGQTWRFSPQAEFRRGPFGAIGEYVVSTVNVRPSPAGAKTALQNRAWQVEAGWVLTGEDSSSGGVIPDRPFDWQNGSWGAWEVVVRGARLTVDDRAFPLLADPATNAREAKAVALGLNWYLSKVAMMKLDYYQTRFGFASDAPAASSTQILRQDEKALITRLQLSY